jgi:8-oxo-dGTP diphosphatase
MQNERVAQVVVAAVIRQDDRYLVTRRLSGTHLAGCWEFPGGKCRPGEGLGECLRREIREELDVEAIVGDEILRTLHAYPEKTVDLRFFGCAVKGVPRAVLGQEMRWVGPQELSELPLPAADMELVLKLTGK